MNKTWKHLVCWRYTMLTTDEPRQYLQKYNEECWSSVLTTEVSVQRPIFAKHLWKNFKPGVMNHPDTWDMIKRPSPNHLVKWTGYYTHVQYMMFSSQPGTSNAGSTSWIPLRCELFVPPTRTLRFLPGKFHGSVRINDYCHSKPKGSWNWTHTHPFILGLRNFQ